MQIRLQRLYPGSRWFAQTRPAVVPLPEDASEAELIDWVDALLRAVLPPSVMESAD